MDWDIFVRLGLKFLVFSPINLPVKERVAGQCECPAETGLI